MRSVNVPVLQMKACRCEEGYTEVMSSNSTLEQCTLIPVVVIPTVEDKRGDVKTSRAVHPTQPSTNPAGRGRTWFLQPFGPGEEHKILYFDIIPVTTSQHFLTTKDFQINDYVLAYLLILTSHLSLCNFIFLIERTHAADAYN